jgi:DNA-binding transcriptional MerR regulator
MEKARRKTFSIGDTAKITGVSQKQIRHWEVRGYITKAIRVVCGERAYRHFSKTQVEQIAAVKGFLDQGYSLPHAARMVREALSREGDGNDA